MVPDADVFALTGPKARRAREPSRKPQDLEGVSHE
jgi:hypothetical protein